MSKSPAELLRHILDEIDYLLTTVAGIDRDGFIADPTLTRAFVRSLEIIGEPASKLPEELRRRYPEVEWRPMIGMRNRLIHGYYEVDYALVWGTVRDDLPILKTHVRQILAAEPEPMTD